MSLQTPNLDDRTFQDIVDELKQRIPHYCPEWTDHNVSDPGVTLIELFAWVADLLLYRMNHVPDYHYVKFMKLLGIEPKSAQAARVPVAIWLSKKQEKYIPIEEGFEVASTQTEREPSIVFSTERDLIIHPAELTAIIRRPSKNGEAKSFLPQAWPNNAVPAFADSPQSDDALEFGFGNDVSHHILQFAFRFDEDKGAGPDEYLPESWPYRWEVLTYDKNDPWQPCYSEYDETKALRYSGQIQIHLPVEHLCRPKDNLFWVRLRVIDDGIDGALIKGFDDSPCLLSRPNAVSVGGTVWAHHARVVRDESIGVSDGSPGQRFRLSEKDLLDDRLTLKIHGTDGTVGTWCETESFAFSPGQDDSSGKDATLKQHFVLDRQVGEVRFGPAIRLTTGDIQQYGAIPARGATIQAVEYRHGGGVAGNVLAGKLDTAKTSHAYVAKVRNLRRASGGLDAEDIAMTKLRAPLALRTRDRAVTAQDFESLAKMASRSVARAKCLVDDNTPNSVTVHLLKRPPDVTASMFPISRLDFIDAELAPIRAYLDERRLLTVKVNTHMAKLLPISIDLHLDRIAGEYAANLATMHQRLRNRLNAFIDPWTGGEEGKGWPFGYPLRIEDVSRCLYGIPEASLIRRIRIYRGDPETGNAIGDPQSIIDVKPDTTLISGNHRIT